MNERHKKRVFFRHLQGFQASLSLQGFRFIRWKCCFLFRSRVLCSEKHFSTGSGLCQDTTRTHCTIPLEKSLGDSALWVLLPYQLLPWVGEITLSDDFIALISRSQCFQKTQILKPSCGQKEEKTEPACTSFRLMTAATLQPHKEMLLLSLGSKSHVKKNKRPCSWKLYKGAQGQIALFQE